MIAMEPIALRPAAPIPPIFDPNNARPLAGWISFFRGGANAFVFWNDRQYQQPVFMAPVGRTRLFYVNDPDLIAQVLKTGGESYRKSKLQDDTINVVLGQGLLGSEGTVWRHDRKLMAPVFQPRNFDSFEPIMRGEADRCIGRLLKQGRNGARTVNVMHETSQLALKVIADILFGGLDQSDLTALSSATEAALSRTRYLSAVMLLNPVPQVNKSMAQVSYRRLNALIDRLAAQFIERYRAAPTEYQETLLGRLIAAADSDDQGGGEGIGAGRSGVTAFVRDQIATMLLAGHETTAKSLAWGLYLLAFDPARANKLRADLSAGSTEYLDAYINELLRLYPAAFILNREVVDPHQLGDRQVRTGDGIMISPWLIHRNPRYWSGADLFRPERWLGEAAKDIPKAMYLPFGMGPRVCIGAALAKLELRAFLTAFALKTDVQIEDADDLQPQSAVTLSVTPTMWGRFKAAV